MSHAPRTSRAPHAGSLLCVPGYLAAALLLTWPLARELTRSLPTVGVLPDALLQAFLLHWDLRTLFTHPGGVFDVPIFHPERNTLTYMDHLLGEAVLAAPAFRLTGSLAAAYDSVVLFSAVASAWATYRLTRWLGVSRGGAYVCGLLFAFSPYRYANMANLNLLQTELLPLGVLFALRGTARRRARDLTAAGLTLALQSYLSWYYTFYLATAYAAIAAHALVTRRVSPRDAARPQALVALLVTLAALLPGLLPYLRQRAAMPGFGRSLGIAAYWSADLLDYLKVNPENRTLGRVPGLAGDQPYFPGLVAVALAAIGIVSTSARRAARRIAEAGALALVGLTGLVLSLGPVLRVAGQRLWIPLPYALLYYVVPGFSSMRASGRYAVLVSLAVTALAGLGYERLRRGRSGGAAAGLFGVALAATLLFSGSTPWPMVHVPRRDEIPPVYAWLARQPGSLPMLDLPVPAREQDEGNREVTRQIYAVYHGKPLVDGVSGFVSPAHRRFRETMQRFPEPEAIAAAAERGTRIVIAHYADWPPGDAAARRRAAEHASGLSILAAFGDDVAYAIVPTGLERHRISAKRATADWPPDSARRK